MAVRVDRLLAAVGCLAAVASVAWVAFPTEGEHEPKAGEPVQVSVDGLREAAAGAPQPIYWAGTRPGTRFELTRTRQGKSFVRYIPDGVEAGDKRPAFLTVATYPERHAYAVAEESSRGAGMYRESTPSGGLATWRGERPSSVYLAYPGTDHLVEVFSPNPEDARRLVLGGEVGPVGESSATEPAPRPLRAPVDVSP